MIIIKEKQKPDEMAILAVSSREDNLPFRITIKSPDHQPPRAHLMDLKPGKLNRGNFSYQKPLPRKPEDIKGYRKGITDEMRRAIFEWTGRPHKVLRKYTNREALYSQWTANDKW
jgi:hypothetical protein